MAECLPRNERCSLCGVSLLELALCGEKPFFTAATTGNWICLDCGMGDEFEVQVQGALWPGPRSPRSVKPKEELEL